MRKYFTYVPIWLAMILNLVLSIIAFGPFMVALAYITGLFRQPILSEICLGILIILIIVLVFVLVNYLVYKICRRKKEKEVQHVKGKVVLIKFLLILVFLIACMACLLAYTHILIGSFSLWV